MRTGRRFHRTTNSKYDSIADLAYCCAWFSGVCIARIWSGLPGVAGSRYARIAGDKNRHCAKNRRKINLIVARERCKKNIGAGSDIYGVADRVLRNERNDTVKEKNESAFFPFRLNTFSLLSNADGVSI